MKTYKTILIVLLILLVPATVGVIIYTRSKNKKSNNTDPNTTDDNAVAGTATTFDPGSKNTLKTSDQQDEFPLTYNTHTKSEKVKECQKLLNYKISGLSLPYAPQLDGKQITSLKEDGYYGEKTAAVVKFLYPDSDGLSITFAQYLELRGGYTFTF